LGTKNVEIADYHIGLRQTTFKEGQLLYANSRSRRPDVTNTVFFVGLILFASAFAAVAMVSGQFLLPLVGVIAIGIALTNPVTINFGLPWNMKRHIVSLRGFLALRSAKRIRQAYARMRLIAHTDLRSVFIAITTTSVVIGALTAAQVVGLTVPFAIAAAGMTTIALTFGDIGFDRIIATVQGLTQTTLNRSGSSRIITAMNEARTFEMTGPDNTTTIRANQANPTQQCVSIFTADGAGGFMNTDHDDECHRADPLLGVGQLTSIVDGVAHGFHHLGTSATNNVLQTATIHDDGLFQASSGIADPTHLESSFNAPAAHIGDQAHSRMTIDSASPTTSSQILGAAINAQSMTLNSANGTTDVFTVASTVPVDDEGTNLRQNAAPALRMAEHIISDSQRVADAFHRDCLDGRLGFFPAATRRRTAMQVSASTSDHDDGFFRHDALVTGGPLQAGLVGNLDYHPAPMSLFVTSQTVSGARKLARAA